MTRRILTSVAVAATLASVRVAAVPAPVPEKAAETAPTSPPAKSPGSSGAPASEKNAEAAPAEKAVSVPSPEKLLPADTLVMVTAPDFVKLSQIITNSPQSQFWHDSAMKAFKEKFMAKWEEELVKPLERDLGVRLEDYTGLFQGQVTFALTQSGWQGKDGQSPGALLLVDARDKQAQLKKNLADLRRKCADNGKTIRTEKLRDAEFLVISLSSKDVPATLRKFFPKSPRALDAGAGGEGDSEKSSEKDELVIGQVGSLLVLGNMVSAVEPIVARLTGGAAPPLAEVASYQANHLAMFRDSPLYGWANIKACVDILLRAAASEKKDSDSANPSSDIKPEKIVSALGLSAIKTLALSFQDSSEGAFFQAALSVPESGRQGLFKIFVPESKESGPPPFVPADAIRFQRFRLDGKKSWASLETLLSNISPQALNYLKMLLSTASLAGKEKDPGFDIKESLIGNLGDDLISYEKAPAADAPAAASQSGPSLFLLGSPHPDEFAAALKTTISYLNTIANPQAAAPKEREFLGHKIVSLAMPALPLPGAASAPGRNLHYAAGGSYVAMSSDAAILEEYLRSAEGQGKTLRETPGLLEAAQKIGGMGTGLFGFVNTVETSRLTFEAKKKAPAPAPASGFSPVPNPLPFADLYKAIEPWMDVSLLPSFDKVSKYFYLEVYSLSTSVDGLTFKVFAPTPPALRK